MIGVVLLTLLVFALVCQAGWLATDAWRQRDLIETPAARRLVDYTTIEWQTAEADPASILRAQRVSRFPWLESLLTRLGLAERLSRDLRSAGLRLQAAEFLFVQLAITALAGVAAFLALSGVFGGVAPAAGAGLLGFVVPMIWLRRAKAKRLNQFEIDLPPTLDLLVGSLRAGYTTPDALEIVARENNGPCSEEFAEVVRELNLGADMDSALKRLLERVPSEDARLLVSAISVQRRTGGNLVDVIKQLGRTLRDRKQLRDEVRVLTTQPRYSGYVSALIPPFMVVATYFTSPKSFDVLVTEPTGRIALLGSGLLVLLGLFLNDRISKVDL